MKKLMIAAAAAAMTVGALADAQVYEYKLSLKSTTCAEGKVAKNSYYTEMGIADAGDEIAYRKSASVKLVGVSWGCDCEGALQGFWASRPLSNGTIVWDGLTFWNPKAETFLGGVYDGTEIEWDLINRIGKKATDVELSFDLVPSSTATKDFNLKLAGLGTIKDSGLAKGTDCEGSYIKSAKGSVAGYLDPASGGCYYCDDIVCDVYDFCDCMGFMDDTRTVAYGTWTMKYNSAASKKLRENAFITSSYKSFPKAIKEVLVKAGE